MSHVFGKAYTGFYLDYHYGAVCLPDDRYDINNMTDWFYPDNYSFSNDPYGLQE